MENINYNGAILSNYQKMYPNLGEFIYDEASDSLVLNGNSVCLNGYGLSRIDPIFFLLPPDDIFNYFKNGFYYTSQDEKQIQRLFNQVVITEDEVNYLERYAHGFGERLNIYNHNKGFFDKYFDTNESVRYFITTLMTAKKVINEARERKESDIGKASEILYDAFIKTFEQNNPDLNNQRGVSLTRKKADTIPIDEEITYQKLGMAGFTSIVLIVSSAIAAGMFLAMKLLS